MATSTSFKQQCPSCEAMVPIRDPNLIGRKIDCPKCKYRFTVEEPADADEDEAPPAKKKTGVTEKPKPAGKNGVTDKAKTKPAPAKKPAPRRDDDDEDDDDGPKKSKKKG